MNKVPNFSIVSANVQGLKDRRKRSNLVSQLKSKTHIFDIVLISETGRPSEIQAQAWMDEFREAGLSSLFTKNNHTAIIWKESVNVGQQGQGNELRAVFNAHEDRITDVTFMVGSVPIHVISIYVPAKDELKRPFLEDLHQLMAQTHRGGRSIVIGGDWNCVEDPEIDSEQLNINRNAGGQEMRQLALTFAWTDVYRAHHPRKRIYTNNPGQNRSKRRLDRIYVSPDFIPLLKRTSVWAKLVGSSHVPVAARFYMPGAVEIGPGKFKLNMNVMASEATTSYISALVARLHKVAVIQHPGDPLRAWCRTKEMLLPQLQELSIAINRFRRMTSPEEVEIAGQYGSALRSRVDPMLAGSSSIFIRLRQVRASDLTPALKVDEEVLRTPNELLGAARDFYEALYGEKEIDDDALEDILCAVAARLPEEASSDLEAEYNIEELTKARKKCKGRSSPGPDGLPFEFYAKTWDVTGPILLDVINFMAEEDPLAQPQKVTHLHLIHKAGDHDQISNKRPITLINADERIMSKAHNCRLAPVLRHIVAPTQTGFIPNRWIGTNIANMQTLFDTPPPQARPPTGLVAIMDFEKAYDRIARPYLLGMLRQMGFGPRAINWYTSTFTNQYALVYMNGWLSTPFEVLSGVRQGDPLAPSLFAIAIEGFACAIRKRVTGLRPWHYTSPPDGSRDATLNMREMLFADDAACALKDYSDANELVRAIQVYEKASCSKLNVSKCHLSPVGDFRRREKTSWRGWKVTKEPFRYLGVTVGVDVDYAEWWSSIKSNVIRRIRSIPMLDLPLAVKCLILNTYCYSKILYVDKFAPAPPAVIAEITAASKTAIWGIQRPTVSMERLQTPVDHGGFGLFNLQMQLDIGRAKWVFELMPGTATTERHSAAIRSRLSELDKTFNYYVGGPLKGIAVHWKWYGFICHPGQSGTYSQAKSRTLAQLPLRWHEYFQAWERCTKLAKPISGDDWVLKFFRRKKWIRKTDDIPYSWFRGPDGEKMTIRSFSQATTPFHTASRPIIVPKWTKSRPAFRSYDSKRWKAWWRSLRKVRLEQADAEDSLHLLNLGSLHPGSQVGSTTSPYTNNQRKSCVICLQPDSLETFEHLLVDCPVAQQLWRGYSHIGHPVFADFICPATTRTSAKRIKRLAVFVHAVWTLARSRRFASTPLVAIDDRQLRKLVKQSRAQLAGAPAVHQ